MYCFFVFLDQKNHINLYRFALCKFVLICFINLVWKVRFSLICRLLKILFILSNLANWIVMKKATAIVSLSDIDFSMC